MGSREYFLKRNGETYRAGDKFIQQDLAGTLRRIAAGGKDAFYRGEIAERMVADMRAHGGLLTMEDLAGYEAVAALMELKREGFHLKMIPEEARFGRVHAVRYDARKKRWTGGADPDWEGSAAGGK